MKKLIEITELKVGDVIVNQFNVEKTVEGMVDNIVFLSDSTGGILTLTFSEIKTHWKKQVEQERWKAEKEEAKKILGFDVIVDPSLKPGEAYLSNGKDKVQIDPVKPSSQEDFLKGWLFDHAIRMSVLIDLQTLIRTIVSAAKEDERLKCEETYLALLQQYEDYGLERPHIPFKANLEGSIAQRKFQKTLNPNPTNQNEKI